jgi:glycosyltransferase involved in cell wall biosynthesis
MQASKEQTTETSDLTHTPRPDCSIVVPLYNEAKVIDELHNRLITTMDSTGLSWQIVFVDDGSTDNTLSLLQSIARTDLHVVVVELRKNFGQTPALAAGFDHATGNIVISMDGDLQHLPEEIPAFLEKLNEGYDVVSGWREKRVDNLITRKIPSMIANRIASKITGIDIHDFGTTFKAYRREVIHDLNLYGEMHRFIPAVLSQYGAKIVEIPIKNIPRPHGTSNYGIGRTFRVAFDLITLSFFLAYVTKPLHLFGKAAFYCFGASFALACYLLFDKSYYHVPILGSHGPLAMLTGLLLLIGFGFLSTGLIAEMISRVYFESTNRKIYAVRKVHTHK